MAVTTGGPQTIGSQAPADVDGGGNRFKVGRVAALDVSAEVIDYQTTRNFTDGELIRDTVGIAVSTVRQSQVSVPGAGP